MILLDNNHNDLSCTSQNVMSFCLILALPLVGIGGVFGMKTVV